MLAYCSSVLYLTGRVSQIVKNHQRQSAEGLALSMFLCAIAANSCYGASILVRSYTRAELVSSLPWLVGSLGTGGCGCVWTWLVHACACACACAGERCGATRAGCWALSSPTHGIPHGWSACLPVCLQLHWTLRFLSRHACWAGQQVRSITPATKTSRCCRHDFSFGSDPTGAPCISSHPTHSHLLSSVNCQSANVVLCVSLH